MVFKTINNPIIRQYVIVITVNLSILCSGFGLGWPSPMLVKLRNSTETVLDEAITDEQGSWVVSIGFLVGGLLNFTPPLVVDRLGRKYSIMAGILPKFIGALLMLFATKVWMLILGRALNGVSDIFIYTVVPAYASEIANKEIRGSLGSIFQIMCSLGVVIMFSVGPFVSYITANAIHVCLVVVTLIPILFLPESPYFLYIKGRKIESLKILVLFRGSETAAKKELNEYALMNTEKKINKMDVFKNKIFWKSFGMTIALVVGAQLLGNHAVGLYLQTILESTKVSISPEISSVIIGIVQIVASIFTSATADKFGRKPILSSSLIGMMLGMIGLGAFFYVTERIDVIVGFMNYLPVISLAMVIFCYSSGSGSLNWVLSSELFDNNGRALGLSISMTISAITTFLVAKFFPYVLTSLGPTITYWGFAINCLLLAVFVVIIIPETKGKTFVEIQRKLGAKIYEVEKI